jgi:hypothetical protein
MSITILSAPQAVVGVKNPIRYKVSTNNYQLVAGTFATRRFGFDKTPLVDGDTLTFIFGDGTSVVYTFYAAGGTVVCNSIDQTTLTTAALIMAALGSERYIAKYFVFTNPNAGEFSITAKSKGTDYTISSITCSRAAVITAVSSTAGVDRSVSTGMKIATDIFLDDGWYHGSTEVFVDDTGSAEIFVEELLKVLPHCELPGYSGSPWPTLDIYCRFYELYNGKYCAAKAADIIKIFNGGTPWDDWTTSTVYTDYFSATSGRKFMTRMPANSLVTYNQPLPMYFYVNGAPSPITLTVKRYYKDGTTETQTSTSLSASNTVLAFDGCLNSWLLSFSGAIADVAKFSLKISWSGVTGEEKMFTVASGQENYRYLAFENSLGGYDALLLEGNMELTANVEVLPSRAGGNVGSDYFDTGNGRRGSVAHKTLGGYRNWKGNTGLRTRAYIEYLQEWYLAEKIFMRKGSVWVPVTRLGAKQKLTDDMNEPWALEIEWREAFES